MTIHEINNIRIKADLTKAQLSRAMKLNISSISRWFTGQNGIPTGYFITKMIEFLRDRRRRDWEMLRALKKRESRALEKSNL